MRSSIEWPSIIRPSVLCSNNLGGTVIKSSRETLNVSIIYAVYHAIYINKCFRFVVLTQVGIHHVYSVSPSLPPSTFGAGWANARRVLNRPVPGKSCSERDRESLANLTCFGEFSSNPIFQIPKTRLYLFRNSMKLVECNSRMPF